MAFEEVKIGAMEESDRYEFDNAGDNLEGRLIDCVDITSREGSTFKKYIVKTKAGNMSFLGCYQLDKALPELVGHVVKIIYQGKDRIGGGKTVKKFQVLVDREAT